MSRRMFDAYNPANLKGNPPGIGLLDMLAAYINGVDTANNWAQVRELFPSNQILSITTDGDPLAVADMCDCENGDYTLQKAVQWAVMMQKWHLPDAPTIYGSRATYAEIVPMFTRVGLVLGQSVTFALSTLDGSIPSLPGVVAVQFRNFNNLFDAWVVTDDSWHSEPEVQVHRKGRFQKMFLVQCAGVVWLVGTDNSRVEVQDPQDGSSIATALGITGAIPTVSAAQLAVWPVKVA